MTNRPSRSRAVVLAALVLTLLTYRYALSCGPVPLEVAELVLTTVTVDQVAEAAPASTATLAVTAEGDLHLTLAGAVEVYHAAAR